MYTCGENWHLALTMNVVHTASSSGYRAMPIAGGSMRRAGWIELDAHGVMKRVGDAGAADCPHHLLEFLVLLAEWRLETSLRLVTLALLSALSSFLAFSIASREKT